MKANLDLSNTTHNFKKTNLVTLKGGGDNYACKCGLKGIRKTLGSLLSVTGKKDLILKKCPLFIDTEIKVKKIRMVNFTGGGTFFENNKSYDVVPCPKEYQNKYNNDIWVQGKDEPVRLFPYEYSLLEFL